MTDDLFLYHNILLSVLFYNSSILLTFTMLVKMYIIAIFNWPFIGHVPLFGGEGRGDLFHNR